VFDLADRHTSISSNQTTLTRYTCSTGSFKRCTSGKKQSDGGGPLPPSAADPAGGALASSQGERPVTPAVASPPATHFSPHLPSTSSASPPFTAVADETPGRRSVDTAYRLPGHVSRASDTTPIIMDEQVAKQRRPRARTMTNSGPAPPAPAQYGLFPRTSTKKRA
jgi:hypothetical protein